MSWTLLIGLVLVLGVMLFASVSRRVELERMATAVRERERARETGHAQAKLSHPVIDLSRCLGCATCVAVCPEDNVLDIVRRRGAGCLVGANVVTPGFGAVPGRWKSRERS